MHGQLESGLTQERMQMKQQPELGKHLGAQTRSRSTSKPGSSRRVQLHPELRECALTCKLFYLHKKCCASAKYHCSLQVLQQAKLLHVELHLFLKACSSQFSTGFPLQTEHWQLFRLNNLNKSAWLKRSHFLCQNVEDAAIFPPVNVSTDSFILYFSCSCQTHQFFFMTASK